MLESGRRRTLNAAEVHATLVVRRGELERAIESGLLGGFRAAAELAVLALALVVVASRFALVAFAALAPFALLLALARRALKRRHERAAQHAEQLHGSIDELLRHLDLWRTYGAQERVRARLDASARSAGAAAAAAESVRTALSGANEVLAAAALVVVAAWVDAGWLSTGHGSMVAFATVGFLMYRPLRDLGDARTFTQRGEQALDALEAVAGKGADAHALRRTVGSVRTVRTPAVRLKGAAWPLAALVVDAVEVACGEGAITTATFRADPGQIVALIGPTGVGKTTLLRALLGLEPVTRGRVRYGSADITRAGVGPTERPFAWVPQEAAIVTGTLRDNVALGCADDRDVDAALTAAGAAALASRERDVVHASGPELSGGERQWIALARALASAQPVLLLDEPTAGLDDAAQAHVLASLACLRGTRTIVIVTHRPEPLAIADRIVTLRAPTGTAGARGHSNDVVWEA